MTWPGARSSVLLILILGALIGAGGARSASAARVIAVSVDRSAITTRLGHSFTFASTITNHDAAAASGLIAHLNVLSLRDGVYVDPEDWSSNRTRYLAPIPAGHSTTITWKLQAVNAGSFGVYVAILPRSGAARPPTTGPAIHVAVAERRTLDSGGILPLVLGIPAALGLVAFSFRLRRGGAPNSG